MVSFVPTKLTAKAVKIDNYHIAEAFAIAIDDTIKPNYDKI
jgi:hypothetical protein